MALQQQQMISQFEVEFDNNVLHRYKAKLQQIFVADWIEEFPHLSFNGVKMYIGWYDPIYRARTEHVIISVPEEPTINFQGDEYDIISVRRDVVYSYYTLSQEELDQHI